MKWTLYVVVLVACGDSPAHSTDAATPTDSSPDPVDAGLVVTVGTLDPTFGTEGMTTLDQSSLGYAVVRETTGRIVVLGSASTFSALYGFDATGALDPTFGVSGTETLTRVFDHLANVADALYLTAQYSCLCVERHLSDGATDVSYGTSGLGGVTFTGFGYQLNSVKGVVDRTGRTVFSYLDPQSHLQVTRVTTAGVSDNPFGTRDLGVAYLTEPLAIQHDGAILVGRFPNGEPSALVRLHDDGSPDTSYAPPVATYTNIPQAGLDVDASDRAVLAGNVLDTSNLVIGTYVARLTASGTVEAPFPVEVLEDKPYAIQVVARNDGSIVVVGIDATSAGFVLLISVDGTHLTRWKIGARVVAASVGADDSVIVVGGTAPPNDPTSKLFVAKLAI